MRKNLRQRAIVILGVTLISLLLIAFPRTTDEQGRKRTAGEMLRDFTSWTAIKANLTSRIKLGLDLKGGTHLVMQVQAEEVIKQITDNNIRQAEEALKKANIPFKSAISPAVGQINVELSDVARKDDVRVKLDTEFGGEWQVEDAGNTLIFRMIEAAADQRKQQAVEQAMSIIDNRINAFGVTEPTIQRHGADKEFKILLQLPGIDNPERVKETVKAESKLELKAVIGEGVPYPTREAAQAAAGPNGQVLPTAPSKQTDPSTVESGFLVVERNPIVTGLDMRDASAVPSRYGSSDYEIHFTLNPAGATRFESWTGANIGKYLAIVLNDQVKSWPTIRDRISDRGQISGDFSKESAEDLALILRSGALPAKITYLEERTVGPSLGADSIRQGIQSSVIGLLFVMAFMIFYYRLSGINAVLALMLNMLLVMTSLALFKATLTLPGIAGFILGIGMAVDSNVLIFERIREELRTGKTVFSAVESGFDKAFLTIIDTHVTTIVSAFFLFIFGTGPIRGFAVTLIAGLVANLFTAIYVSKTIFGYTLGRKGAKAESLSI